MNKNIRILLLRFLPLCYLFYYDWKVGISVLLIIFSFEIDILRLYFANKEFILSIIK